MGKDAAEVAAVIGRSNESKRRNRVLLCSPGLWPLNHAVPLGRAPRGFSVAVQEGQPPGTAPGTAHSSSHCPSCPDLAAGPGEQPRPVRPRPEHRAALQSPCHPSKLSRNEVLTSKEDDFDSHFLLLQISSNSANGNASPRSTRA